MADLAKGLTANRIHLLYISDCKFKVRNIEKAEMTSLTQMEQPNSNFSLKVLQKDFRNNPLSFYKNIRMLLYKPMQLIRHSNPFTSHKNFPIPFDAM